MNDEYFQSSVCQTVSCYSRLWKNEAEGIWRVFWRVSFPLFNAKNLFSNPKFYWISRVKNVLIPEVWGRRGSLDFNLDPIVSGDGLKPLCGQGAIVADRWAFFECKNRHPFVGRVMRFRVGSIACRLYTTCWSDRKQLGAVKVNWQTLGATKVPSMVLRPGKLKL